MTISQQEPELHVLTIPGEQAEKLIRVLEKLQLQQDRQLIAEPQPPGQLYKLHVLQVEATTPQVIPGHQL